MIFDIFVYICVNYRSSYVSRVLRHGILLSALCCCRWLPNIVSSCCCYCVRPNTFCGYLLLLFSCICCIVISSSAGIMACIIHPEVPATSCQERCESVLLMTGLLNLLDGVMEFQYSLSEKFSFILSVKFYIGVFSIAGQSIHRLILLSFLKISCINIWFYKDSKSVLGILISIT